jgi:hypothetical protein
MSKQIMRTALLRSDVKEEENCKEFVKIQDRVGASRLSYVPLNRQWRNAMRGIFHRAGLGA